MATLYVSDLDGTLLDPSGQLSTATEEGLQALLSEGLPFTVASARSVVSIRERVGLPLQFPVVCGNGTFTVDFLSGQCLKVVHMAGDIAERVCEEGLARRLPLLVNTFDDEERMYVPTSYNEGTAGYVTERQANDDPRLRLVPDVSVALRESVTGFLSIAEAPDLVPFLGWLEQELGDQLQLHLVEDFYRSQWRWLTVTSLDANKGHAVRSMMNTYPELDRLVVFGDEINDLPLFQAADYAVAVGNAVDDVKAAADEVIGAHHDDAVLTWLKAHTAA